VILKEIGNKSNYTFNLSAYPKGVPVKGQNRRRSSLRANNSSVEKQPLSCESLYCFPE